MKLNVQFFYFFSNKNSTVSTYVQYLTIYLKKKKEKEKKEEVTD